MGFDHSAPKRPANLNLNSDLVEKSRSGISNLSAHVEALLAADLEQRQNNLEAQRRKTEPAVDAFTALYKRHGSLSEEMQTL